eukprot:SAG31_NODE_5342_length_2597_cov_1.625300_4_plen_210_part_00
MVSGETSTPVLHWTACHPSSRLAVEPSPTTNSAVEGLQEALQGKNPHVRYKVILPPERGISAWIGGSIIGSINATPWELESWHGPNADRVHNRTLSQSPSQGCYWPQASCLSLIVQCDKTASLVFASQLLAWAKATEHCSLFDELFDRAIVGKIGVALRAAGKRGNELGRGPALQSDSGEMAPCVKAEERSATKPVAGAIEHLYIDILC